MRVIIANAFSLQMIQEDVVDVHIATITEETVIHILSNSDFISAIGHADTANVVSNILGISIPCNRVNITLDDDTMLIVAQIQGGRLPEGCTTLPDGVKITFKAVQAFV